VPGSDRDLQEAPRYETPQVPAGPGQPVPPAPQGGSGSATLDNRQIARITLDEHSTGGCDLDGSSGDDGIAAVIEPRDQKDQVVLAPAAISLVLLDPALEGDAARIARWDLAPEQIAAACRDAADQSAKGFMLVLGWPTTAPANRQLQLFARYTTSDGRKLEASGRSASRLPGEPIGSWTPATRSWRRDRSGSQTPGTAAAAGDTTVPAPALRSGSSEGGPTAAGDFRPAGAFLPGIAARLVAHPVIPAAGPPAPGLRCAIAPLSGLRWSRTRRSVAPGHE